MSKLVEGTVRLAEQIHGGHVEREQEVRDRKTREWEHKREMAEFQHRLTRDRAIAADLARTERHAYVEDIHHQATAIRAEGQALRERAHELRATQTIPFVNDVRQRVNTIRHRLSGDIAVMRQLLADPEYTTRVAEALETGESIPSPTTAETYGKTALRRPIATGQANPLGGLGGATGALGGVLGGVTGAVGGVTDAVGGAAEGATGTLGGVTGAATSALGGATGALEGITGTLEGAASVLEEVADALGRTTGTVEEALEGATDTN